MVQIGPDRFLIDFGTTFGSLYRPSHGSASLMHLPALIGDEKSTVSLIIDLLWFLRRQLVELFLRASY